MWLEERSKLKVTSLTWLNKASPSHPHTLTPSHPHTVTGHPYTLHITTGARPGAGTDARVYMQLCGHGSCDSGRVWLEGGGKTLGRGQTDSFSILSPRLVAPLESLVVGHDNTGHAPGWFLEKVRGHGEPWSTDLVQTCKCARPL